MIAEVDVGETGSINFPEFVLMMADRMAEQDKVVMEMRKALKAFDPDQTGMIEAKKLVEVMLTMGDKMGKMDTEEMMSLVGVFDGQVLPHFLISRSSTAAQFVLPAGGLYRNARPCRRGFSSRDARGTIRFT